MSFSNEVKNELSRLEVSKKCCERAELLGLLRVSGAVILQGRNMGIHFSTENAALARRMLQMLKSNSLAPFKKEQPLSGQGYSFQRSRQSAA